jgi:hypothetical protein
MIIEQTDVLLLNKSCDAPFKVRLKIKQMNKIEITPDNFRPIVDNFWKMYKGSRKGIREYDFRLGVEAVLGRVEYLISEWQEKYHAEDDISKPSKEFENAIKKLLPK